MIPELNEAESDLLMLAGGPFKYGGCLDDAQAYLNELAATQRRPEMADLAIQLLSLQQDVATENEHRSAEIGSAQNVVDVGLDDPAALTSAELKAIYSPVTRTRLNNIMRRVYAELPEDAVKARMAELMNALHIALPGPASAAEPDKPQL